MSPGGCSVDRYDDICSGRFDHIDEKLERIDLALRGNGTTVGMQTRLDRLEQAAGIRGKLFLIGVGALPPTVILILSKVLEKL